MEEFPILSKIKFVHKYKNSIKDKLRYLEKVLIRSYQTFSKLEFPSSKYCKDCVQEEYCKGCISEAVIRKDTVDECKWQNSQVLTETLS